HHVVDLGRVEALALDGVPGRAAGHAEGEAGRLDALAPGCDGGDGVGIFRDLAEHYRASGMRTVSRPRLTSSWPRARMSRSTRLTVRREGPARMASGTARW